MALLPILTIPHPVLKTPAKTVRDISCAVAQLVHDMEETMLAHQRCVGIAAPQVARSVRIVIVDISRSPKPHPNHGRLLLINPVITAREGSVTGREGCLSVPDFTGNVTRSRQIQLEALTPEEKPLLIQASGFEAVALQHEIDHLDGILFLDRVSSLKTDVFRRNKA